MDKYLYNKLRRLHRPGRGKQMKAEILQQFLVKALTERPKDLEAEFKVCHGVAVRAKHKLESLKIRLEMAAVMFSTAEVLTTQVDMNLTRNLRDWMSQ